MLDFSDARSLMEVIRDYYNERKRERGSTLAKKAHLLSDELVKP